MTATPAVVQRHRRHASNVASDFTVPCKQCARLYRKGWGNEDGYCSQTCRNLSIQRRTA